MKLSKKYNKINLLSTVIIFILSSIAFTMLLRYVLIKQVDEDLEIEQHEIRIFTEKYGRLPEPIPVEDQQISYISVLQQMPRETFSTSKLYDKVEKETNDFRLLIFTIAVKGRWVQVSVAKSLEGTEAITKSVLLITVATILSILIISFLINRLIFQKLWQPFYQTLYLTETFKLGQTNNIHFPQGSVDEFNTMNSALEHFIQKAEADYRLLKEFNENASHELQTPVAVIRSKLDLLIQDEHLSEPQSIALQSAYEALQKLARLNQSLLLLNKIENRQFTVINNVGFDDLLRQKIDQFKELFEMKQLQVNTVIHEVIISMNMDLADILLNNLFTNAINHSREKASVSIELSNNQFSISNSAAGVALKGDELFQRFYKSDKFSPNHGLGLSIVKEICDIYHFQISYSFNSNEHVITIIFPGVGRPV